MAAAFAGGNVGLDLLAQNLDLPLDKLGLHPDDFIDILGLNDLLGEVER